MDDRAVFDGLCKSLGTLCAAAEQQDIYLVVEITRAGSVGSAETFLHLKDRIGSPALRVCFDGANFTPDRTPLERAVRMLGPDIVVAHGKDMWFTDSGEVGGYCATGSGKLDYGTYIRCLQEHDEVPYIVFEACGSREELLEARDTVQKYL